MQFEKISLEQDVYDAAKTILLDRKHLDNNPTDVKKDDISILLNNEISKTKVLGLQKTKFFFLSLITIYFTFNNK